MVQENSTVSAPKTEHTKKYSFESETRIYEIDAKSEKGKEFTTLFTGPEKIKFLKENGREATKKTGGRIMLPEKGAWRFYNVGQLEYMFRAVDDNDYDSESQLEKECKEIERRDEKREFILKNATKIREWPERIHRVENLV